jgi:hypothetical protein
LSISCPIKLIDVVESFINEAEVFDVVGTSLILLIEIETVAVSLSFVPLLTLNVKLSEELDSEPLL